MLHIPTLLTDVTYNWLTVSFSASGFKPITLKSASTHARLQATPKFPKFSKVALKGIGPMFIRALKKVVLKFFKERLP